jgi:hypothetical protein
MNSKKRRALEIQAAIARIHYDDWDPIGLAGVAPRDEYDTYVGGVYRLLASGATAEQIAEHLVRIEREAMGYDQATIRDLLPIARKLQAVDLRLDTEGKGKR